MKKSVNLGNKAALKNAERWIVAAYVWKLLYFPFSWIVSLELMPITQLRPLFFHVVNDCKYVPLFGDIVFLALAIIAFIKLHGHTNRVLRKVSRWFIVAYTVEVTLTQTNAGMVIGNYLYEATGYLWLFFPLFFIVCLLAYSPLVMTIACLGESPVLAHYHLPIICLSTLTFVSSGGMFINCLMQLVNEYLRLYDWELPHITLFSIIYSGCYMAYILCWWKLFHIPYDIPAIEDALEINPVTPMKMEKIYIIFLSVVTVFTFIFTSMLHSMMPNP